MELNHRPHAYQACALTKLSYRPIEIRNYELRIRIPEYNPFKFPFSAFQIPNSIRPIIHFKFKRTTLDLSKLNSGRMSRKGFFFLKNFNKYGCILRKEVIQPLVPQRLPCYDFTPIISHTLGAYLSERS